MKTNWFKYRGKIVKLTDINNKEYEGIVNCVCDEGDDEPDAKFLLIDDIIGVPFSYIKKIEIIGEAKEIR